MAHFERLMQLDLPEGQSAFLWGARQTGKSTYLRSLYGASAFIDLLDTELFLAYVKAPHLFREHILSLPAQQRSMPIVVDEIQKCPILLNEVHALIERDGLSFVLCGSSARKMRQAGVNLLGGRAWRFDFYPLTSAEIPDMNLLHALSRGLIPNHYTSTHYVKGHKAYIANYLRDEIQLEGLVRNLSAFARFLDVVGMTHGGLINYSNIASDVGVNAHTVREYFQILVDTMLGYQIYPYHKQVKRQIINKMPKFYLFDVGIANRLARRDIASLSGAGAGAALEHFILMELMAYRGLKDREFDIAYWRTKSGREVDFILGEGEVAVEVKISTTVRQDMLGGLKAFMEEHQPKQAIVVSLDRMERRLDTAHGPIMVMPWRSFLARLWAGDLL